MDRFRNDNWENVGYYELRERDIDVELEPGERLRLAGCKMGNVPYGAPAGFIALFISDYVYWPKLN